jgi:hypothetical protein
MSDQLPIEYEAKPLAQTEEPMAILKLGVEKGIDAESIERLSALAERWQDRRASEEFADCLAKFQGEVPEILQTKVAKIVSQSGSSYQYTYAPLDLITRVARPILHRLGFAFSWDSVTEGAAMTVTCTLRHVNGHRESASFTCPLESPAKMSGAQKAAAAMSFARRQTLTAILGLTTTEDDIDGADPTPISEKQAAELTDLATEVGANVQRFLTYMNVDSFEEILASDYNRAISALKAKGARKGGEAE